MKIEDITREHDGKVIGRLIKEANFDEWLTYLFDRPESDYGTHWCFERPDDEPVWDAPRELSAEFIARTYEDPKLWLNRFSDAQLAAGLEYTWNPSHSDVGFSIRDGTTPMPLRLRAVRALVPLYERCFLTRCEARLSHGNESLENPLNGACYMYWDVCPFHTAMDEGKLPQLEEACLQVMEATLQLDHDACRESALHGLSHWYYGHPKRVEKTISGWLKERERSLRPELVRYAKAASRGDVQ